MAVFQLDNDLWFPDPHQGEEDGLIAVGGDLSVDRLLLAYSYGFFPWFSFRDNEEPLWFCPMQRFVIFPSEIHISHSMQQLISKHELKPTINKDFDGVIRGCSKVDGRNQVFEAWLGPDIIKAYTALNRLGYAFSVEVWEATNNDSESKEGKLVGGLYGVSLRNAFFGESMFSLVPNASKLALIYLAQTLAQHGGVFIDCQFETPHLKSMGGKHITYDEYLELLK